MPSGAFSTNDYSTINGTLTEVDQFDNTVDVRWLTDITTNQYEELTLKVTPESKIFFNGEDITLEDIDAGQPVTIEYYLNPKGEYILIEMTAN